MRRIKDAWRRLFGARLAAPVPLHPSQQDVEHLPQLQGVEEAALATFRRADKAGDGDGARNLGAVLEASGDTEGAMATYRRADDRGHAHGAALLGILLEQRGNNEGALSAYRRTDERGDAQGVNNVAYTSTSRATSSARWRHCAGRISVALPTT